MRRTILGAATTLTIAAVVAPAGAQQPQPASGAECLAKSEEAIQLRKQQRLREARAQLLQCIAESCPSGVRADCTEALDEVNTALPTIVFEVKDGAGGDLAQVRVTMDGKPLVERVDGTAITLDPGDHRFTFETPGQAPVEKSFVIRQGEKDRRERIVIGPVPAPIDDVPPAGSVRPSSDGSGMKTTGLVIGGVGLVGLAVGTFLGLSASSKWSSSQDKCASPTVCPDHAGAIADHDSAQGAATGATIAFVAGGAALAAGAVLFFTAPKSGGRVGVAPSAGANAGGMSLVGRF